MSSSNCCFLTCIQVSQKSGKVVWYSHLFKNVPQFVVIHTVKGFSLVTQTEVDVFLEFSCFFCDLPDVGNLIPDSSAFSKSSLDIWKFLVHILLKPNLKNFSIILSIFLMKLFSFENTVFSIFLHILSIFLILSIILSIFIIILSIFLKNFEHISDGF